MMAHMKLPKQLLKLIEITQKKVNRRAFVEWQGKYNKLNKFKKTVVILCALLIFWFFFGLFKSSHQQKIHTAVEPAKVLYIESKVEEREKYMMFHSIAEADDRVQIFAPSKGRVSELKGQKGDMVRKDQELVIISPLDYSAILAGALNKVRELEDIKGDSEVGTPKLVADLKTAQTELEKAKRYSRNMIIRSPITGRIEKSEVRIGDEVKPDQELFLVVNPEKITYKIYVTDHLINKINLQSTVMIRASNGSEHKGAVTFVSRAANAKNLSYEVDVTFDNKNGDLLEGASAELLLAVQKTQSHKLPLSSLIIDDAGDLGVMIYNPNDKKAHFVKVEIIDQDQEYVWVAGPDETAEIITMGQGFLRDGSDVQARLEK